MDKRGSTSGIVDVILGILTQLVTIIVIVAPIYAVAMFIYEPEDPDQQAIRNFESLADTVTGLCHTDKPYVSEAIHLLTLADQYTIIGFNKEDSHAVYETCGVPLERIDKPEECYGQACLCMFFDDTNIFSLSNTDFNDRRKNGKNRIVVCEPLQGVDYIFSHPYGLIKNEDYCEDDGGSEYLAYAQIVRAGGLFQDTSALNTRSCSDIADLKKSYSPLSLTEGSIHDGDYYGITSFYDDFVRNFRGFFWQGPEGFEHSASGGLPLETAQGERTLHPTSGVDGARIKTSAVPKQLNYFEDAQRIFAWCKVEGHHADPFECLTAYNNRNTALGSIVDDYDTRYLYGKYSSFALYGECDADDQVSDSALDLGTPPSISLANINNKEWNSGGLYVEKYTDSETGKVALFFAIPSQYTKDRFTVLDFFNKEQPVPEEVPEQEPTQERQQPGVLYN